LWCAWNKRSACFATEKEVGLVAIANFYNLLQDATLGVVCRQLDSLMGYAACTKAAPKPPHSKGFATNINRVDCKIACGHYLMANAEILSCADTL
jgi:hypothetical protein